MPKSKYEDIYRNLKQKIESNEFASQELLPSENSLIQIYDCSRNTVRRALSRLVADGYVQTIQGKAFGIFTSRQKRPLLPLGKLKVSENPPCETDRKQRQKWFCFWK